MKAQLEEDKWSRMPAPVISDRIHDAVRALGGLIPSGCGRFGGEPLFKLVWGGDATKFWAGKERLRFPARGRRIKRFYAMREDFQYKVIDFIRAEQKKQQDAYLRLDLSASYQIIEATPFIRANGIKGVDYYELDASLSLPELARKCAILDFQFFSDTCVFEQIGKPFWYLLRYAPTPELQKGPAKGYGTMLETEKEWNSGRFGEAFCPEIGEKCFLDLLGEYPKDGGYLSDFFCFETVEPLTLEMVETVIGKYVKAREEISERYKNDKDYRMNQQYLEDLEEFDRENDEWSEGLEEMFWDAIPAFDRLGMTIKGKQIMSI